MAEQTPYSIVGEGQAIRDNIHELELTQQAKQEAELRAKRALETSASWLEGNKPSIVAALLRGDDMVTVKIGENDDAGPVDPAFAKTLLEESVAFSQQQLTKAEAEVRMNEVMRSTKLPALEDQAESHFRAHEEVYYDVAAIEAYLGGVSLNIDHPLHLCILDQ